MKTAKDFLFNKIDEGDPLYENDYIDLMVEFAKYHVEKALQTVSKKARLKKDRVCKFSCSNRFCDIAPELPYVIDTQSIKGCYPLNIIK